jgi:hypothetical protein
MDAQQEVIVMSKHNKPRPGAQSAILGPATPVATPRSTEQPAAAPRQAEANGVRQPTPPAQPQQSQPQPLPITEEQIRLRAYQKWEAAGKPEGDDHRFWLEAERELRGAR